MIPVHIAIDFLLLLFAAVWQLPGVEEYSDKTVSVSSSQGLIVEWSGLKLDIHKGSLPDGCKVHIKSSLAGEYEIPEGSGLVSAVYWVRCEPQCTITKPITVEIPHCSATEDVSKLKIVKAACSQKSGSYEFKPVGGRFDAHTSYGVTEMTHSSGYGVVEEESPDPRRKYYYCQPFYRPLSDQNGHVIRTCIIFVWNTEPHITVRHTYTPNVCSHIYFECTHNNTVACQAKVF